MLKLLSNALFNHLFFFFKGTFNSVLNCQVIDKIADFDNPLMITDKGIIKIPIEVFGNAVQYTTAPAPKFSNGKKIEYFFSK